MRLLVDHISGLERPGHIDCWVVTQILANSWRIATVDEARWRPLYQARRPHVFLLWHEVLVTWKAAKERGERPIPALFNAMDKVLDAQAARIAIPRRFEATIKEIWALQPRFEQRAGSRPARLLEHPRFRAAYDFLMLRGESGEAPRALVDWWTRFQNASHEEREAMLRPEEAPKKRRRSRSRKRRHEPAEAGATPPSASDDAE